MNLTSKQNEIVRFIWNFRKTRGIAPTLSEIADELGVSKITVHEHISLLEKKGAIKKEKYQSRSLKLSRTIVKELEAVDEERERLGLAVDLPRTISSSERASSAGANGSGLDDAGSDDRVEGASADSRSTRTRRRPAGDPALEVAPGRRAGRIAASAAGAPQGAPSAGLSSSAPRHARAPLGGAHGLPASGFATIPLLGKIAAGVPIEVLEDQQELDIASALRLDRASYALRVRGDSMIDDGIHDGDYVLVERRSNPTEGETVVAVLEGNEATLKRFYRDGDNYKLVPANRRLQPICVPRDKLEIRGVVVGQLRRY